MGCLKLFEEVERIPWQVHKKGESSSKAYVYAYNNPVNFSDPAGLAPVPMDAGNDDGGSGKSGSGFLAVLTNAWNRAHGARGDGSGMGVSYSGGGRMGWSNGTGYNADGSVHDPSASYTEMAIAMMKLNDSEYGGTWTPGGGISYFNSHEGAVEYGSNYNDHHNAWGNFKGGAKSRKGARDRLYTRKMLAQELKLDLKYALAYCGDCNFFQKYADAWANFFESFGRMWKATMVPSGGWGKDFLADDKALQKMKDKNNTYLETDEWAVEDPVYREGVLEWDNTQPLLGKIFTLWGPKIRDANVELGPVYTLSNESLADGIYTLSYMSEGNLYHIRYKVVDGDTVSYNPYWSDYVWLPYKSN